MLVLSRKRGESIQIGRDVTVTLLSMGRGRAKIGISAPCDVKIARTDPIVETPDLDETCEPVPGGFIASC